MVSFIMLHAQLYFLFVFDFPEMVAPYLKCIFVWGSIKFLFLSLCAKSPNTVTMVDMFPFRQWCMAAVTLCQIA